MGSFLYYKQIFICLRSQAKVFAFTDSSRIISMNNVFLHFCLHVTLASIFVYILSRRIFFPELMPHVHQNIFITLIFTHFTFTNLRSLFFCVRKIQTSNYFFNSPRKRIFQTSQLKLTKSQEYIDFISLQTLRFHYIYLQANQHLFPAIQICYEKKMLRRTYPVQTTSGTELAS